MRERWTTIIAQQHAERVARTIRAALATAPVVAREGRELRDFRQAQSSFRHNLTLTGAAIITLALAVGGTALYSRFPDERAQFWVPYAVPTIEAEPVRTIGFNAIGRLKSGVTPAQVEVEGTMAARALPRLPSSDEMFGKGGQVIVRARPLADDIAAVAPEAGSHR